MKINPISNVGLFVQTQSIQNKQRNNTFKNTSINEYGKNFPISNIVFQGTPRVVRNASILDKVSVAFKHMGEDDAMLIITNNINKGKEAFRNIADEIINPISKLLFISIPSIDTTFAIQQLNGIKDIWNLDDKSLLVEKFTYENGIQQSHLSPLKQDGMIDIDDNSLVIFNKGEINFNEKPKNVDELDKFNKYFLTEYNFQKMCDDLITNHNYKVADLITNKQADQKNDKKAIETSKLSFSDIGGQEHIIKDIKRNILFPLMYPDAFIGFQQNRGAIFYGVPGTGKSLMAEILCSISGATSYKISGSELDAKYVGESEKNWRELHQKAVDSQPSIIFIDEIDAIGKNRGKDTYGDKVLNQILSLMSEDEKKGHNVYWIGATNRLDTIDPALKRAGRFGKHYEFLPPQKKEETEQIFNIHVKNLRFDKNFNKSDVINEMFRRKMSGAAIKMIVDDARINAFERYEIFKSMEEGTYTPAMLEFLTINNEDFDVALSKYKSDSKSRNPIGFVKNNK